MCKTLTHFDVERRKLMQTEPCVRRDDTMERRVEMLRIAMGEPTEGAQPIAADLYQDRIDTIHAGARNQSKVEARINRNRLRALQLGELLSAACRYLFESNCAI